MSDESEKNGALTLFWKKARTLLPIELILAIGAAIAIFAHYDAKAEEQGRAIVEVKADNLREDSKIEATRLEIKKDQDDLHEEVKQDWKAIESRLDKISADIEQMKFNQIKMCSSNKIKCQ
jgi:septal ring factor EnvC (AmiA/AmiB activator)